MFTIFLRTLILYFLVMLIMRLMGKRQIGQLQPFEFVLALMVADLSAIPITSTSIPLFYGIIPVTTLFLMHTAFSWISMKSGKFRAVLCGKPIIVIERGIIQRDELKKLNYNLSDLMEQLRVGGFMDVSEVDYAILETNGNLSVLEKKEAQKATVADLSGKSEYGGLPLPVVKDGKLQYENITKRNLKDAWITDRLKSIGVPVREILVATIDERGKIYVQTNAGKTVSSKQERKGNAKNGT